VPRDGASAMKVVASYQPGQWTAVAGPSTWLLIDTPPSSVSIDEIWQAVCDGADHLRVLDFLVHTGMWDLPGFALVALGPHDVTMLVRGSGSVEHPEASGPAVLRSENVATWLERRVPLHPGEFRLAGGITARDGTRLPLTGGVVSAGLLVLQISDREAREPISSNADLTLTPLYDALLGSEPQDGRQEQSASNSSPNGYDHLFGMTVYRSVEEAAVRPAQGDIGSGAESELAVAPLTESGASELPPQAEPGVSTLRHEIEEVTLWRRLADPLSIPARTVPTVNAVLCPDGHPNPEQAGACRVCRKSVAKQPPVAIPRPVLGVLRMSTGDLITLDRGVVIGRNPQADREVGGERAHVVRVSSPDKDISRNHMEVRLDGWRVLVTDLGSTNGTWVARPGEEPQRLGSGEALPIEPGTAVSLADHVSFRFEVSS
jgi:hypothetical protein